MNTKMKLLTQNEPDLFAAADGDNADSPFIVCCDHAGRCIPEALAGLGLPSATMDLHIAYDVGAGQVSRALADRLGAPLLLANYSRLVIDLNRHLHDSTLIPTVSDGIVVPGNTALSHADRRRRIDEMFVPYHARYGEMVGRLQQRTRRPIIVAVHSFAAQIQGVQRPWDFGLLWDEHEELARAVSANLAADDDLCIGHNEPYHALNPRGYAMTTHAQDRDVEMALIEIRQDLVADASRAGVGGGSVISRAAAACRWRRIAPANPPQNRRKLYG